MKRTGILLVYICVIVYILVGGLLWLLIKDNPLKNILIYVITVLTLVTSYSIKLVIEILDYHITRSRNISVRTEENPQRLWKSTTEVLPDVVGLFLIFNLAVDAFHEATACPGALVLFYVITLLALAAIVLFFIRIHYSDLAYRK